MHMLRIRFERIPMFVRVGLIIIGLLIAIYLLVAGIPGGVPFLATLPIQNSAPESVIPTLESRPRETPATAASEAVRQEYVSIIQQVVDPTESLAQPEDTWGIQTTDINGYGVLVTLPLKSDVTLPNDELVQEAKEMIAAAINALFVANPDLDRVGVVCSMPDASGQNIPIVSIFIQRAVVDNWGTVPLRTIEANAQGMFVEPALLGDGAFAHD